MRDNPTAEPADSCESAGHAVGSFLFLPVRPAHIPVRPELQAFDPIRSPAHYLADFLQFVSLSRLDDDLVMYMPDDPVALQAPHRLGQDVPADGLDDVLRELRSVGLQPFPFLCWPGPVIADFLLC